MRRLALLTIAACACALTFLPPWAKTIRAAVAHVNLCSQVEQNSSAATVACTITGVTSGNALVGYAYFNSAGTTINSVGDTVNTYTLNTGATSSNGACRTFQ